MTARARPVHGPVAARSAPCPADAPLGHHGAPPYPAPLLARIAPLTDVERSLIRECAHARCHRTPERSPRRDGRQEREEVRLDLISVAQELAANRERLLFEADLTQRIAAGTRALTEIMGAASASRVVTIQDTLVFLGTMVPSTLDVSLGAVDALIASGRLARIENPTVRRRLAGLRDLIEDAVEGELRVMGITNTYLDPLLDADVDRTLVGEVGSSFWLHEERIIGRGLVSQGQVDFPNTLALRNILQRRALTMASTSTEMRTVLREIVELLELITEPA